MRNTFLLLLIISGLTTWANTNNTELTPMSPPTKNTCSFTNNTTFNSDSITEVIALRDYQYYEARYKKAYDRKVVGLALIGGGVVTAFIGYRVFSKNILVNDDLAIAGFVIHLTGVLVVNTGIPLFAWGETEENRNKKAMEKYKQTKTSLRLAPTENGVGLVLTF